MPRYINKTVILAKVETTAGTDAAPTGAANAIQVSDLSITPLDAQNIETNTILPYFGGSVSLVGSASVKCSFSVLLAGSGTAATPPAWGALLQGCAQAETSGLTAPNRVEYLPVTDSLKTLTIYYHDDGVLHKLVGSMGNAKYNLENANAPKITFDFIGLDGGATAAANPTATLTAWKVPVAVTKANTAVDITLGCTYAAGALSGGTAFNSAGLSIDLGNSVNFTPMLSTESIDISDRKVTGSFKVELSAAQEVSQLASVKANTLQGLGFVLGTTSGNKILVHMPQVQLLNLRKEETNGRRLIGFDFNAIPASGNDELRIVCL